MAGRQSWSYGIWSHWHLQLVAGCLKAVDFEKVPFPGSLEEGILHQFYTVSFVIPVRKAIRLCELLFKMPFTGANHIRNERIV